ncbi:hypothetical protein Hdeb2414_s0002g00054301 [Helianthus debilis subsp. tardiflorus]
MEVIEVFHFFFFTQSRIRINHNFLQIYETCKILYKRHLCTNSTSHSPSHS